MNATAADSAADYPQPEHAQSEHAQSEHTQSEHTRAEGQPLSRPVQDRMLAGVAAGVARYLHIDATLVRIVLVVLTVAGGSGLPLYLAGWLLIPEEDRARSLAGEFIQSLQAR